MREDYDVIVVGAGPSGLSTAKTIVEKGLTCLIIEKRKEIGSPVRTSGASWLQDMIELGIPMRYLNPISEVSVIAPGEEATITFDQPVTCILDVAEVYKFLASQAIHHGAELRLQSHARNVIIDNGFVHGVELESKCVLERIRCKVVVDASGVNASLVRKLGLLEQWSRKGVGFQYDIESSGLNCRKAILFLGRGIAPSGYGWFFPWKKDRARLGVGIIRPDSDANPSSLARALLRSGQSLGLEDNYTIIEKETGIFPCAGPIKTSVTNGFLAVGDAAGLGSPLHGEGIRYAIRLGIIAGDTIHNAVQMGDASKGNLSPYEKVWKRTEGKNFRIGLSIQKRISRFTDEHWNESTKYLRQIGTKDPELLVQLFKSNFSYESIWRIFKYSPLKALKILLRSR